MTTFWNRREVILAGGALTMLPALATANDNPSPYNSEALLVVYPDYPVNTDSWYGYTTLVGHAGVLLINAAGLTKYFEYGRYDAQMKGELRTYGVPNAVIGDDGKATPDSLKEVLRALSARSGKPKDGPATRIQAAYFINMDFDAMSAVASGQPAGEYDLENFNCGHFALKVVTAGNPDIDHPTILVPVPVNIVDEYLEEGNAEVLFDPADDSLRISGGDESDAKE